MGQRLLATYVQAGVSHVAALRAVRLGASTFDRYRPLAMSLLALAATAIAASSQVCAQAAAIDREYAIKAAFLYQFSKYVEWPAAAFADAEDAFVIGVYKANPFDATLQKIAESKRVGDRPIIIKIVTAPEQCRDCHILFVSESVAADESAQIIRSARTVAVLVVGESGDFVQQGGDAQFFLESNKVRFAFHDQIADRRGLKVSSKLLTLARPVPALTTIDTTR